MSGKPSELDDRARSIARFLTDIGAGPDGTPLKVGEIAKADGCPIEAPGGMWRGVGSEAHSHRVSSSLKRAERMGLVISERSGAMSGGPLLWRASTGATQ